MLFAELLFNSHSRGKRFINDAGGSWPLRAPTYISRGSTPGGWLMSIRGCTAVIDDLVQTYPEDVVVEQPKKVYREQIRQAVEEIDRLLLHYHTQVADL